LIEAPFETAAVIDIQVVYSVTTFAFLDDYEDDLQNKLLASAVIGALQCNTGGPLFGVGGSVPTINMVTIRKGEACPLDLENILVLDNTNCNVFETSFQIIVVEDFDPAVAALLAYIFIREEMSSGAFIETLPLLDSVEYLRPVLPDILPIETPEIPNIDLEAQGSITVSPWTIGAVVAMCKYISASYSYRWGRKTQSRTIALRYLELRLTFFYFLCCLLIALVNQVLVVSWHFGCGLATAVPGTVGTYSSWRTCP
jgi:hypothetical protein